MRFTFTLKSGLQVPVYLPYTLLLALRDPKALNWENRADLPGRFGKIVSASKGGDFIRGPEWLAIGTSSECIDIMTVIRSPFDAVVAKVVFKFWFYPETSGYKVRFSYRAVEYHKNSEGFGPADEEFEEGAELTFSYLPKKHGLSRVMVIDVSTLPLGSRVLQDILDLRNTIA